MQQTKDVGQDGIKALGVHGSDRMLEVTNSSNMEYDVVGSNTA